MGWWGLESCSNDGCWDLLGNGGIEDIHEPLQEDVEKCLERTFSKKDEGYRNYYNDDERVGVVIWLLDHGMVISDKYLKIAEEIHTQLLQSPDEYFDAFTGDRKSFVEQELEIIKGAKTTMNI